ncbi:MAG: potassium-transporting ATPase subunit KdpC [Xanthobacteraceae bacterium]|nr:potassium-transporting ATPase subunit KdpC [Xanthobacteraceae bacterium]
MFVHLRPAFVLLILMTVLTGICYPLAVTGVAQAVMPAQANGSLILRGDQIVGSELIGQNFTSDRYFRARLSATVAPDPKDDTKTIDAPYNAANSSGSNFGPLSKKLIDRIKADAEQLAKESGGKRLPADAVTASASGLDPHISPAYAALQVARVAGARGLPIERVAQLVAEHTEGRFLGVFGELRVNVLKLNLALDRSKP